MANKKVENMSFEASTTELDSIVSELELGELALEDALKKFERGITLARHSQQKLSQAEQRVEILLQQDENAALTPFDTNDE
ncbi:exodeoxyribonuclease VII small subunit [Vibrio sp. SS-MA-C1-2]|uniref:exodeoxyribonuclease VII small subunit n=1 Tax=Vibrio sp. SS-MA-C1-2 TaxID=2908646 RepID=UPI001F3674DA|nr:exodeoxyribonuclease VII small subunit [Vibrio sp. SS-MA-C1-2]UJF18849.1 exodeoxyribonuclease VII small subunit [Vibrio sp. SS-MA-C1-2]